MENALVGGDDELAVGHFAGGADDLGRGANPVGKLEHPGGGFRVGEHRRLGVHPDQVPQAPGLEFLVNDAGRVPKQHLGAGGPLDVGTQVAVRRPQDLFALGRQMIHQLDRDARSHHPVGPGLDRGGGIGIDDHGMVGVGVAETGKLIRRTGQIQRACRLQRRHQHRLAGAEDLRRFPHEANPRNHEHIGAAIPAKARHFQAVANEAATGLGKLLQLRIDIIMRHHRGIPAPEQVHNRRPQGLPLPRARRIRRHRPVEVLPHQPRIGDQAVLVEKVIGANFPHGEIPGWPHILTRRKKRKVE